MYFIIILLIKQSLVLYLEKRKKIFVLSQYCKIYKNKYLRTNITKKRNRKQKNISMFKHLCYILQSKDLVYKQNSIIHIFLELR